MIKALLVYRNGGLDFQELRDASHLIRVPVYRGVLRSFENEEPVFDGGYIRFVNRGKAGPYQVYEEN